VVTAAVQHELSELAERDAGLADSGLAALAVAMAQVVDDPGVSPTARAQSARALLETLDRLHELAPPEESADGLDELVARRERRRTS
jgi:hypothetical protein